MKLNLILWTTRLGAILPLVLAAAACGGDSGGGAPTTTATSPVTQETSAPATTPASPMAHETSAPAASVGDLSIFAPTARAMVDMGAAYMRIVNTGAENDALIGATTDVAGRVQLHRTVTVDNTSRMEPVGQIDVPAGGEAVLMRGGYHVMLLDLTRDLQVGDTFDITLTFKEAGSVTVRFTVGEYAESGEHMNGMEGMQGMATPGPGMDGSGMGGHATPTMGAMPQQ